ncbi:MAG: PorP/SprF family type IX secretion system membrane protein [Bacteroidales bacterium]|nr:PorP/SprF family type IX secretion system membrane protein [Bacteroidales bacterium]
MKWVKHILILLLVAEVSLARGQDVRFSSLDANPMFLNPALTGFCSEQFRAGTVYRNQWSSVSTGLNSYLLTAETQVYTNRKAKLGIGLGVEFLADVAGSLSYGSRNIGLAVSIYKSFGLDAKNTLSIGLKGNRSTYSYDITNADFGNNPSNTEGIPLKSLGVYDFSLGLHWQSKVTKTNIFQAGLNLMHFNRPTFSYFENSSVRMPIKTNLYSSFFLNKDDNYALKPLIFGQLQDNNTEIVAGSEVIFPISIYDMAETNLAAGLYYRILDALIVTARYHYGGFNIGISYDVNLSKLTPASKTYGAVEIWLNYAFNFAGNNKRTTHIPCPVF